MAEAVTTVSPKGTAVYPWLTKADTQFNPDGEFRVTLRVPREEAQDFLNQIEACHQEQIAETQATLPKGKKVKIAELPVRTVYDDEGNETDEVDIRFKTKASFKTKDGVVERTLPIVDAKKKPLPKGTAVFGGSVIKIACKIDPFYNPSVGAGVTLRINAVQVLELVTRNGGGDFGFDEEEGYETEDSEQSSASTEAEDSGDF